MVFVGLSVGVAAIYYVLTLRTNQRSVYTTLETRQAQLFMPIYANFYREGFIEAVQEVIYQWQWSDYDDYQAFYRKKN